MQPALAYGTIAETQIRNGAIMRPTEFSADTVIALLRKQTIASLSEVMAALGARASRRTAFRKLKDIDARTSYSHRGGFYTLDELAHFDERGLWSFAGVRFSRAGTLIATANACVPAAPRRAAERVISPPSGRPPTSMCSVTSPSTRHSSLPCRSGRQAVRFWAESVVLAGWL